MIEIFVEFNYQLSFSGLIIEDTRPTPATQRIPGYCGELNTYSAQEH